MEQKQNIRKQIKIFRDKLPQTKIIDKSEKIIQKLTEMEEYKTAKTIMAYVSLNIEVNTQNYIKNEILKGEKILLVPYLENDQIKASIVEDFNDLEIGNYGVLEPIDKKNYDNKIDIILIPGLAFDKKGFRLGFGKGYYDKFLKNHEDSIKIGLGFEEQIIDSLPIEPHDVAVDMIITEKKILRCYFDGNN